MVLSHAKIYKANFKFISRYLKPYHCSEISQSVRQSVLFFFNTEIKIESMPTFARKEKKTNKELYSCIEWIYQWRKFLHWKQIKISSSLFITLCIVCVCAVFFSLLVFFAIIFILFTKISNKLNDFEFNPLIRIPVIFTFFFSFSLYLSLSLCFPASSCIL